MDIVCERENFYGFVQYGFRRNRSTTDCVFMILAAIRTAKKRHRSISIAFCDIAKAYDSVCRELLYTKLRSLGFGGRVVSLIKSMYNNDCVRISVLGGLSEPLYFTKGVKQGCSLSPLLFSLYIASLGTKLHDSKLGIKMGTEVITALFFADDLVLISGTPKTGMNKLLKIVSKFCNDMKMELATTKTYILSNANYNVSWKIENDTIEEILIAKYLGIHVQVRGRNMIGKYEDNMIKKAMSYAYTIMNLTRSGLDRAMIARKLWETCAVPAILYCTDALTIKKSTMDELDRIQNMIVRFILQVPAATSRALGWMDAGLMPMKFRIQIKQAGFIWNIVNTKKNPILIKILREMLDYPLDPWTKSWMDIQSQVGNIMNFKTKKLLIQAITYKAVSYVVGIKTQHATLNAVPQPWDWFRLQVHVNDSRASKTLCQVRGGNAQLGNRYKNRFGKKYEWCPYCATLGVQEKLNEAHVILVCPCVSNQRRSFHISNYMATYRTKGPISNINLLSKYLGGDGANNKELMDRGRKLNVLIEKWISTTHDPTQ